MVSGKWSVSAVGAVGCWLVAGWAWAGAKYGGPFGKLRAGFSTAATEVSPSDSVGAGVRRVVAAIWMAWRRSPARLRSM